jgi:DNA-binding NarL/FixJ family response regulator
MLVGGSPGLCCVGAWRSAREAIRQLRAADPEVLLLDLHLPDMLGSEAIPLLLSERPATTVLMLTVYEEADHVFTAIAQGACGYLLKRTPPARLLEAIREAHGGGAPMSPEIARKVIARFRELDPEPAPPAPPLSEQEGRLLALFAQGHTYQGAAEALAVSVNTVRTYVRRVYEKLQAHSRHEAVATARRQRLL